MRSVKTLEDSWAPLIEVVKLKPVKRELGF